MVQKCGLTKGDRVLLCIPVIMECLVGMLACTRIGAIHTVIYTGFGYKEIAMRIKHFEVSYLKISNAHHNLITILIDTGYIYNSQNWL